MAAITRLNCENKSERACFMYSISKITAINIKTLGKLRFSYVKSYPKRSNHSVSVLLHGTSLFEQLNCFAMCIIVETENDRYQVELHPDPALPPQHMNTFQRHVKTTKELYSNRLFMTTYYVRNGCYDIVTII